MKRTVLTLMLVLALPGGLRAQTGDAATTAAARDYQRTGRARTLQSGAAVVLPYGHTQPVLTCAPLRACTVQLQENEQLRSAIPGDSERWIIEPAPGPGNSSLVAIKPTECDLTTNLVLSTDRRVYHLTLDSPKCRGAEASGNPDLPYVRHIRFYYPDDLVREFAQADSAQAVVVAEQVASVIPVSAVGADPTTMNFNYRWQRDRRFPWVPEQVFDDGVQTYIRLPASARHGVAPILFELGDEGEMQILNYAMRGDYYVADRVLRRAVLVVGRNGAEDRLLIVNRAREGGRR